MAVPQLGARELADEHIVREIEGLRSDFRDFSTEVRGVLRTIADPVSGYVPRSEISEMRENIFRAINLLDNRIDGLRIWIVGLGLAYTTLLLSIAGFVATVYRIHP